MAPRRSPRMVGVARKKKQTATEDEVAVEESVREATLSVEEKKTQTPRKVVKVISVEESDQKKAREEKTKENGVEKGITEEPTPAVAAEKEQKGGKKKSERDDEERQRREEATETAAPKEEKQRGGKKIGKENERKKIRKRRSRGGEGYRRYVFRVLKQVHPELGVSSMAMAVLNGFMNDMFERIVNEAAQLSKYARKMTMSAREIQGAVRLVLPGELGKHAVAEGVKAVTIYYSNVTSSS